MRKRTCRYSITLICALFVTAGILSGAILPGSILLLFNFDEDEGSYPDTDLVIDSTGSLYGMTVQGGEHGAGTVFRLTHTTTGWVHRTLHDFAGGADGGQPYGGVTLDAQGNVYGTAVVGGAGAACEDGCGVAFKLTKSGTSWTHSTLYNFTGGSDGSGPGGPIVFDNLGNLYGMTAIGGDFGLGVIYQLTPQAGGSWAQTVIHHFTGGADGGSGSSGRLLIDANRNIFGVATTGGANGTGTVFQMTPTATDWTFTTLYAFQAAPDGVFPYGGLIADASGTNLYGTTYYGGTEGVGVVYNLHNTGGTWNETVLYSFKGGNDGASPIGGLVVDANGNLYGTTSEGGASCSCGTIFQLIPLANGSWRERIYHRFTGTPDGGYPYAGLVVDSAGRMYGATVHGGEDDDGSVFVFKP